MTTQSIRVPADDAGIRDTGELFLLRQGAPC